MRILAATILILAAMPALAQSAPRVPTIKPGALAVPPRVLTGAIPVCDLTIQDIKVRFPIAKKRPYVDIMVRNQGKAACGAPPPNGYNFIVVGELYIESYYRMPVKDGGQYGFTTLKLIAHENDRKIPDFLQSLPQLDNLKPGETTTVTITPPNGYCAEPDPKCIPDYAKYIVRADVRFWAGGKPTLAKALQVNSTVMAK